MCSIDFPLLSYENVAAVVCPYFKLDLIVLEDYSPKTLFLLRLVVLLLELLLLYREGLSPFPNEKEAD